MARRSLEIYRSVLADPPRPADLPQLVPSR
jgi:hypothetical protein